MDYAKRTCNICGIRRPQPEMHRVEKTVHTGNSKRSLSAREVVGASIGQKRSQKSLLNWLFSPNSRKYTRKREVWMCGACAQQNF